MTYEETAMQTMTNAFADRMRSDDGREFISVDDAASILAARVTTVRAEVLREAAHAIKAIGQESPTVSIAPQQRAAWQAGLRRALNSLRGIGCAAPPPDAAAQKVEAMRALLRQYDRAGSEWIYLPEIRAALMGRPTQ